MSPEDVVKKMTANKKQDAAMYDMRTAPLRNLKKRLDSSKDQEIHFVNLEKQGSEGMTSVVLAVFELHGPASKEYPEPVEHALLIMKGTTQGGKGYEWWVEDVTYPYKPRTAALPEKPVDDGHGHGH